MQNSKWRHFACVPFDGTPASGGLARLGVGIVSEIRESEPEAIKRFIYDAYLVWVCNRREIWPNFLCFREGVLISVYYCKRPCRGLKAS